MAVAGVPTEPEEILDVDDSDEVPLESQALIATGGGLEIDIDRMRLGKYFEWGMTGIVVTGRPDIDVCGDMAKVLEIANKSLQFAFGDFMNWCEAIFGEEASQLIPDDNEFSLSTQKNYQWVAGKVPPMIRQPKLSFAHHQHVAKLNSVDEQKLWLERALEGTGGKSWNAAQLKKAMSDSASDVVFDASAPKFQVVVECTNHDDVVACCRQLENLGRTFKAKESAGR